MEMIHVHVRLVSPLISPPGRSGCSPMTATSSTWSSFPGWRTIPTATRSSVTSSRVRPTPCCAVCASWNSIVADPSSSSRSRWPSPAPRPRRRSTNSGRFAAAPIWEEVEARIRAEGAYLPSFYVYLVIAGVIGAVGILTNSQILIVAAMVVRPEYGAITSVALGIDRGDGTRIRQGLSALTVGFPLAVVVTFLFSWTIGSLDLQQPEAYELGFRPVSTLIDAPNFFSVVVAVLAGIVGIMSLTQARTTALLGVFISVTTIPGRRRHRRLLRVLQLERGARIPGPTSARHRAADPGGCADDQIPRGCLAAYPPSQRAHRQRMTPPRHWTTA